MALSFVKSTPRWLISGSPGPRDPLGTDLSPTLSKKHSPSVDLQPVTKTKDVVISQGAWACLLRSIIAAGATIPARSLAGGRRGSCPRLPLASIQGSGLSIQNTPRCPAPRHQEGGNHQCLSWWGKQLVPNVAPGAALSAGCKQSLCLSPKEQPAQLRYGAESGLREQMEF